MCLCCMNAGQQGLFTATLFDAYMKKAAISWQYVKYVNFDVQPIKDLVYLLMAT